MDPVAGIVSAIFKVLQAIAKAEKEARRNRTRCRDLARRAQVVTNVLRDVRTACGPAAAATRRIILCRLKEALDDALKLVESCGGRDGGRSGTGLWFRIISALLDSRARAARFDDVDKRINNCLVELSAASGLSIEKKIDRLAVAGHHNHPRTNKPEENKAGTGPKKGATGQGGQNGGKGGGRRRGKNKAAAAASKAPPPPVAHSGVRFHQNGQRCTVEDPNSCFVM